jgi:NADH-quinone oxidoreductase subunit I
MNIEKRNGNSKLGRFIKKVLFIDLVKGLSLTLSYNLSRSFTMRYPDEEKWIPYKRFRGQHTLNRDPQGRELCVGCELCAKSCPTQCITVVPMEDDTGRGIADRVAKVWKVDLARCMYCGFCEDACPTEALKLGREYELACFSLDAAVKWKDELLTPMGIPITHIPSGKPFEEQKIPDEFEGGVIARARFERTEKGIRVIPDLSKCKKWW